MSIGSGKARRLPGDNSTCNDFSIGPDKALYISDTANAKIYRLAPGARSAELFLRNKQLDGIGLHLLDPAAPLDVPAPAAD